MAAQTQTDCDLGPRRTPRQQRSRERVRRILDATAELLTEVGVDPISTNTIARRAGIQSGSLYQYFPNKSAVLKALVDEVSERLTQGVFKAMEATHDSEPGPVVFERAVDAFVAATTAEPHYLAIAKAVRAVPELAAIDHEWNERIAEGVANSLDRRSSSKGATKEMLAAGRLVVHTTVAIVELMPTLPKRDAQLLLREHKRMLQLHLATLLNRRSRRRKRASRQ